jgi:hypothetical protein
MFLNSEHAQQQLWYRPNDCLELRIASPIRACLRNQVGDRLEGRIRNHVWEPCWQWFDHIADRAYHQAEEDCR